MSKIEWTEKTWNPTIGCDEISTGCRNCYAAKMAWRLAHIPAMQQDYWGLTKKLENGRIVWTGEVREMPDRLQEPSEIKKPTVWFVDSMSDLFHKDVSWNFIYKVFERMLLTPWHTYQVLTKRANRLHILADIILHLQRNYPGQVLPLKNVWIGVSVENQKEANNRRDHLKQVASQGWLTWVSNEPCLSHIDWSGWEFIQWMVTGGESGHKARPMHPDWARTSRDWCKTSGIPFFFKQFGEWAPQNVVSESLILAAQRNPASSYSMRADGTVDHPGRLGHTAIYKVGKKEAGRILDGRTHDEFPNEKEVV